MIFGQLKVDNVLPLSPMTGGSVVTIVTVVTLTPEGQIRITGYQIYSHPFVTAMIRLTDICIVTVVDSCIQHGELAVFSYSKPCKTRYY